MRFGNRRPRTEVNFESAVYQTVAIPDLVPGALKFECPGDPLRIFPSLEKARAGFPARVIGQTKMSGYRL